MTTLDEFVNKVSSDPELSEEDKQDLIFKAVVNREKNKTTKSPTINMQPESLSQGLANTFNNTNAGFGEKLGDRVNGALAGAAIGSPGGIPGALLGLAGGAAFPPHNTGELAGMAVAPEFGVATGGLVNSIKSPVGKIAGSGIGGILSMLGIGGVQEGVNRAAGQKPQPYIPSPEGFRGALPYAIAGGGPMLGQMLTRNMVKDRPISKGFEFTSENTPKVKNISDLQKIQTQTNLTPEAEVARLSGANLSPQQQNIKIAQEQVKQQILNKKQVANSVEKRLADTKVRESEYNLLNAKVEDLRNKVEVQLSDPNYKNLQPQPKAPKIGLSNERANLNLEKTNINDDISVLNESLKKLQDKAESFDALHPGLSQIASKSPDVTSLIKNVISATPEAVAEYRQHLASQPNSNRNIEAFQNTLVDEFFKRAYDPVSKTLTKAPELFTKEFNPDKLRAIFGSGADAEEKVQRFTKVINGISQTQNTSSMLGGLAKYTAMHAIWVLPNMLVFHPETLGTGAALGAGVAGSMLAGIAYPKLIDGILKNPKLADSFYKWTTGKTAIERSLASWPRLASWLKANADPIQTEKIKNKLSF